MIEDNLTEEIMSLIVKGHNRASIELIYCTQGVSKAKVKECWKQALNELGEASKDMATSLREVQLNRYLDLYKQAEQLGDYKAANSILNSIDKLFGLQTQKVEMDVKEYTISFE